MFGVEWLTTEFESEHRLGKPLYRERTGVVSSTEWTSPYRLVSERPAWSKSSLIRTPRRMKSPVTHPLVTDKIAFERFGGKRPELMSREFECHLYGSGDMEHLLSRLDIIWDFVASQVGLHQYLR